VDRAQARTDPGKPPQFSFIKEQGRVSVFRSTSSTSRCAQGSSRSAATSGIGRRVGFTALSSGFASCDYPDACSRSPAVLASAPVQVWFERWMVRIPLPLTGADRDAGYWWELSMRQIEVSAVP
jgi:hypothetical protein